MRTPPRLLEVVPERVVADAVAGLREQSAASACCGQGDRVRWQQRATASQQQQGAPSQGRRRTGHSLDLAVPLSGSSRTDGLRAASERSVAEAGRPRFAMSTTARGARVSRSVASEGSQPSDECSTAAASAAARSDARGALQFAEHLDYQHAAVTELMMKQNLVKQKIRRGEPTIGTWLSLASVIAAEQMALAGFDWLTIDLEHAPPTGRPRWRWSPSSGRRAWRPGSGSRAPLTRTSSARSTSARWASWRRWSTSPEQAARGRRLLQVPAGRVSAASPAGATTPPGERTRQPTSRTRTTRSSSASRSRTEQSVDDAEEILAVPGVDCAFVGPQDLTGAMGLARSSTSPGPRFRRGRRKGDRGGEEERHRLWPDGRLDRAGADAGTSGRLDDLAGGRGAHPVDGRHAGCQGDQGRAVRSRQGRRRTKPALPACLEPARA